MRFAQMCESHYVMEVSLVREKPALRWDSKGAPYYLVAKGRHGQKIELYSSPTLTELESALTRGHRADWADFELSLLHSNSYAQNGFCYPIEDQSARYAVFAVTMSDEGLTVYLPRNEPHQCDVRKVISVSINERMTGFFSNRHSGIYKTQIMTPIDGYNGGLFVRIRSYYFPITPQMLSIPFYVRGRPIIESSEPGYVVNQ